MNKGTKIVAHNPVKKETLTLNITDVDSLGKYSIHITGTQNGKQINDTETGISDKDFESLYNKLRQDGYIDIQVKYGYRSIIPLLVIGAIGAYLLLKKR